LQLRLKPNHPDILRMQRIVAAAEKRAEAEASDVPIGGERIAKVPPTEAARRRRAAELHAELDQLDRQIATKQAEEKRLRGIAAGYQERVDKVPARESEMAELTRDYTTLQAMYTSMLAKKEDASIAANLERRQIGEQFKLLDPARLPERPVSPDRPRLNMLGMAVGFAVGLALVGLLEYRDSAFTTDDEITNILQLPVLAVVPLMESEAERRRAARRRLLVGVGMGTTVALCLAVVAYTFIR
jgi:hypothetical protein